jgi:hypothetical protein
MCELFFIQKNYHNITVCFIYDMNVYFLTSVPEMLQRIPHAPTLKKDNGIYV